MPIGFLDDDPLKQRASIHGVRVLGSNAQLLTLVEQLSIDEIVIAMPSTGNGAAHDIMKTCQQHGIAFREVRGVIL